MKIITIIIITLFNFNLQAQIKGKLTYKIIKNDKKIGLRESESIIYFNGKSSIEFPFKKTLEEMKFKREENHDYTIASNIKPSFIYKNFSRRNIFFDGIVGFKPYLASDSIPNFKWKITKERGKVLNYSCTKAVAKFRGRTYTAWYTDEISIRNGPWKFCDLPGLIIKVNDEQGIFTYILSGIDIKSKYDESIISVPKAYEKDKVISYSEYVLRSKKKALDFLKLSKVTQTSADGSSGSVTIYQAEEMEKF
ncbi:GLPGLI family protein [Pedobacter aquatilis]|uniref:GLPGLI family protein n=1 Tax=Pedobacter aquatilis TaxID=351343 RepID=UPI0025B437AE|nr:GLPGLI family protein [Pedobacter aquatilis]MDN3586811.1 GLPGLI family protein [Pedobacter aquatilis]